MYLSCLSGECLEFSYLDSVCRVSVLWLDLRWNCICCWVETSSCATEFTNSFVCFLFFDASHLNCLKRHLCAKREPARESSNNFTYSVAELIHSCFLGFTLRLYLPECLCVCVDFPDYQLLIFNDNYYCSSSPNFSFAKMFFVYFHFYILHSSRLYSCSRNLIHSASEFFKHCKAHFNLRMY